MRSITFFVFYLIFFLPCVLKGQTSDEKIDSVLEHNFRILERYLKDMNSDPSLRRVEIISFFERITEIDSDADGTYIGKLSFTYVNFMDWKDWIARHRRYLFWNSLTKQIEKRVLIKKTG